MKSVLMRLESTLFHPDPFRVRLTRALLYVGGAALAALLVAAAGPIYSIALVLVTVGAVLVLHDLRWGFIALVGVLSLLPFGALPFKLGFTPTFLDVALLALFFVWVMRIATRRQQPAYNHRDAEANQDPLRPLRLQSPGADSGSGATGGVRSLPPHRAGVHGAPRRSAGQSPFTGTWLYGLVLMFLLLLTLAFAGGLRYGFPSVTTIRNVAELVLAVLLFFLVANTARDEATLYFLTRVIIVGGAAAAAIAILFYVIPTAWTVRVLDALGRFNYPGGPGALRYIEDSVENPMRAIGTMVDPNVLGGFMVLLAGLTWPQLVSPRPLLARKWVALFLALEFLALYLTYSRGSLAGLAAGLVLIGLLRYRRLLLVAAAGALLLLLLPPAQAYVVHLVEGIQLQDRATLMRLGEYKDAFSLISRYPWFGVGFSGSPDADLYVGVSSVYLLMAEEMGIIGVLAFLAVVGVFLGSLWWAWRRLTALSREGADPAWSARMEALLLGLGAGVTGAMVGGFFDHYLFNLVYPHMSVLFWLLLGLGTAAVRQVGATPRSRRRGDPP